MYIFSQTKEIDLADDPRGDLALAGKQPSFHIRPVFLGRRPTLAAATARVI